MTNNWTRLRGQRKDKLLHSEDCHVWNQQYNPQQIIKKQWCMKDSEWRKCPQVLCLLGRGQLVNICVSLRTLYRICTLWVHCYGIGMAATLNILSHRPWIQTMALPCLNSVHFPVLAMQSHTWKMFAWNSWGICFHLPIYYGNMRNREGWMIVLFMHACTEKQVHVRT